MPKIPVFVSRPSQRTAEQEICYQFLLSLLVEFDVEPKTIEPSEYPFEHPLKEVRALAERCAGGVVLGYARMRLLVEEEPTTAMPSGIAAGNGQHEVWSPTPWNNLEAGILYGLRLPLLIFRDEGVGGGIFEPDATGEYVHLMPNEHDRRERVEQLRGVLLHWRARVAERYFTP